MNIPIQKSALPLSALVFQRRVTLGKFKSAKEYLTALKKEGQTVTSWAIDLLMSPEFACAAEPTEINLVGISVEDLGFNEGGEGEEILNAALKQGLELCPAEAGPALRLAFVEGRPDSFCIAMKPIHDEVVGPSIFWLRNDNDIEPLLTSTNFPPDGFWEPDQVLTFVRSSRRQA